jgi:hypothetical protein
MSSSARWALSPLDCLVHLLVPEGDHPGVLKAQCGAVLPLLAVQFAQPPARQCQHCHLVFLAAFNACQDEQKDPGVS